jgi:Fe-S-cluster-containing hydrogenase component 2
MKPHRALIADPKKCNGCSLCRTVCSMVKSGARNPAQARIRIIRYDAESFYLPVICQHCQDAPCMAVCPREAIYRDSRLDRVMIDYDRCISCRMCMATCPFGALGFESERQTVYKCDLCGGNPLCVRYCFPGALDYVEDYRQQNARVRKAAGNVALGSKGGLRRK